MDRPGSLTWWLREPVHETQYLTCPNVVPSQDSVGTSLFIDKETVMTRIMRLAALSLLLLIVAPFSARSQVPPPPDGAAALNDVYRGSTYSPYAGRNFPSRVFWGDTHLHTSLSIDAGAFGNRLGLDDAY